MLKKIIYFILLTMMLSLSFFTIVHSQVEDDPIKNPLKEGTYYVGYFEDIIRRTMTGSLRISEEELSKYQNYYKFYYSKDELLVTLMIERYEKLNSNNFFLIQRFMFDALGNIVKEQTFNFKGKITGYVIYNYDSEGRLLNEKKYSGKKQLRAEKRIIYNEDGSLLRKEFYSKGKMVKKEIYGKRNKVEKLYIYYYFPNGNLEKKEEYDSNNTITKITFFDEKGKAIQKIFYDNGEIDKIVNMQPQDDEEEIDNNFNINPESSFIYGNGIGPSIVIINEMLGFIEKYIDKTTSISSNDVEFKNNNIEFIFAILYSQGINLDETLNEIDDDKNRGKLYYLWQFLSNSGWTYEKDYKKIIQKGDLLFFDKVYDANEDGDLSDPKTHIAIVENVDEYGTVTFIHSQGSEYGGIQRGFINPKAPGKGKLNSMIMINNVKMRSSQLISGIARPDYLELKIFRN